MHADHLSRPSAVRHIHANTAQLEPRERMQYWNEVVREHIVELDCRAESASNFLCAMEGYSSTYGAATHIQVQKTLKVQRHRAAANRQAHDAVILNLMLQGEMRVAQTDQHCAMQAGEFSICVTDQPYSLYVPHGMQVASFRLPFDGLSCSSTLLRRLVAQPLGRSNSMASLLCAYANELHRKRFEVAECSADQALKNLSTLLGAVLQEAMQAQPAQHTDHGERLIFLTKQYVIQHINRENLSVAEIAANLRVSTRYLQQLWASEAQTLQEYIAARRLDAVLESLANPARKPESITQIAMSHGFVNMSHFSRFFKSKIGVSPSVYRNSRFAPSSAK